MKLIDLQKKKLDQSNDCPYDMQRPALFDNRIWMNTKEAAEYLRVSVNGLRLKVWKRQLPAYKFDRHLRFKKSDLDQYMRPLR